MIALCPRLSSLSDGCDEVDDDPNPYMWEKCHSVDPPFTTLSTSENAEECLAYCKADHYNTCAYQFNGCFGAMGPPSDRSDATGGASCDSDGSTWQFAASQWKPCTSVNAPSTSLSASSGAACYDECKKGAFATCAWQSNACYGSHAEEVATSGCDSYAVQVYPQKL